MSRKTPGSDQVTEGIEGQGVTGPLNGLKTKPKKWFTARLFIFATVASGIFAFAVAFWWPGVFTGQSGTQLIPIGPPLMGAAIFALVAMLFIAIVLAGLATGVLDD